MNDLDFAGTPLTVGILFGGDAHLCARFQVSGGNGATALLREFFCITHNGVGNVYETKRIVTAHYINPTRFRVLARVHDSAERSRRTGKSCCGKQKEYG